MSMQVMPIPIDSEVLGRPVLSIQEFSAESFADFEAQYRAEYQPFYVSCKVPMDRIADIHFLEDQGFRYVECQLKTTLAIRKERELPVPGYGFEEVTTEEMLAPVLEIAGSTFVHDRYTTDPQIPTGLAGERYRRYVRQSFLAPDEKVFRLFSQQNNETLAFKTHRTLGNGEVLLLLGGVHPDYKAVGLGAINAISEINYLYRNGIRRIYTHISAANYPILTLEVSKLGFKLLATYGVLRKIYPSA